MSNKNKQIAAEKLAAGASEIPYVFLGSSTPFKTHGNSHLFPVQGEKNKRPSKTIPDLTFTVAELVTRFTQGKSLGGSFRELTPEESEMLPLNWDKMDISERHSYLNEKKAELEEILSNVDKERKLAEARKQDDEINRRVEEKLKARREVKNPQIGGIQQQSGEAAQ